MGNHLNHLFLTIFTAKKTGKILFNVCFGSLSQSIGRGRLSREGALDHRESRERRDKIFAAKTENAKIFKKKDGSGKQFSVGNFHFFWPRENNFFGGYNFKTG